MGRCEQDYAILAERFEGGPDVGRARSRGVLNQHLKESITRLSTLSNRVLLTSPLKGESDPKKGESSH